LTEHELSHDPGFLTVSNLLSLSRIPLGVAFLAVDGQMALAIVAGTGALTDLLDGMIARMTGTMSEVGRLLDPFCDKIFVLLGLVSFLPGPLDWAGFLILILRDIFTAGSYLIGRLVGKTIPFESRLGGKLTTALQVLSLFALIFWPEAIGLCVILVGATSVFAIIDYGEAAIRLKAQVATG
jgi:phosphatidylglycerophosphate synthase